MTELVVAGGEWRGEEAECAAVGDTDGQMKGSERLEVEQ